MESCCFNDKIVFGNKFDDLANDTTCEVNRLLCGANKPRLQTAPAHDFFRPARKELPASPENKKTLFLHS
jgi:hypothetical protein